MLILTERVSGLSVTKVFISSSFYREVEDPRDPPVIELKQSTEESSTF